jgi:acyl carrier protein
MPAQEFTFADLKTILVSRIGVPSDQVPEDPAAELSEAGLDSLALVELSLAIQQRYGFDIPDGDAVELATVGGAIGYVNRRLQEG